MTGIYLLGIVAALLLMYRKKQYRRYIVVMLIGSALALCMRLKGLLGTENDPLFEIMRQESAGGEKVIELEAEGLRGKESLRFKVGAQAYTSAELEALEQELWNRLQQDIRGENASLEHVTENLLLPESVEGYPFLLVWSSSEPQLIAQDGKLAEEIPEEGVLTELHLRVSEPESAFEKEHIFYIKVFPSDTSEAYWKRLEKHLKATEESSRRQGSYRLPESFEGEDIRFYKKSEDKSSMIFLLSIVGAAALAAAQKKEREKKAKERLMELEREYPQLAVRMAMLTDTGLTISGAFKRIAADYERKREQNVQNAQKMKKVKKVQKEKLLLPLYEEMLVACREMESGIAETAAYQNMGKRCQTAGVLRLMALLVQYTKSGAAGLKQALREEANEALKERKEYARRKGEEAGTKLLAPMMLMLVLVMVVIMIPAFTSFGI